MSAHLSSPLELAFADFERFVVRGEELPGPPPAEDEPLDEYESGTVLDPEDAEVLELLREIGEYERRGRSQ